MWALPPSGNIGCMPSPPLGRPANSILQVPLQNVPLNTSDSEPQQALDVEPSQHPSPNERLRTTSRKAEPICLGHFHNRHIFQQQLIEKQKKKLQEQQKTILELKESQRLAKAQWAVARASAVTDIQNHLPSNPREDEPKRTCQVLPKYVHFVTTLFRLIIWDFSLCDRGVSELSQLPDSVISPLIVPCKSTEALCTMPGT